MGPRPKRIATPLSRHVADRSMAPFPCPHGRASGTGASPAGKEAFLPFCPVSFQRLTFPQRKSSPHPDREQGHRSRRPTCLSLPRIGIHVHPYPGSSRQVCCSLPPGRRHAPRERATTPAQVTRLQSRSAGPGAGGMRTQRRGAQGATRSPGSACGARRPALRRPLPGPGGNAAGDAHTCSGAGRSRA